MLTRQLEHLILLIVLLVGVAFLASGDTLAGQLWGVSTKIWLWLAVAVPVLHQIAVALLWRAELYYNKMTEWFGSRAFEVFRVIFTVLFLGRPVTLILLGVSNRNTLTMDPLLAYAVSLLLFLPFAYTMYSVFHYFGIDRAYGIDHFDPSYRKRPFVRRGMFRYTDNAMYTYGFLVLWVIGLLSLSRAALLVAAFSHLYIWVHFYTTELPDIRYIYRECPREAA